jgi:hypothetical protein
MGENEREYEVPDSCLYGSDGDLKPKYVYVA